MGRSLLAVLLLAAACVAPQPELDPHGAVKPGQRLVVMVYQSPGPWIVADPDSKAETALKLLPLGSFLQGMQEDKINDLSKEIQPYLPRPHYGEAVERALIAGLKAAHDGPVLTAAEAGIDPRQRRDWNAAADQLDWRRKYFVTDPGRAARDYTKLLSLDDAIIVDVNLSYGLEPDDAERTLPRLSAATRLYRADTNRLMASREDGLSDSTSSGTLSEFRAAPADLTDRLYSLSTPLGTTIARSLATALRLSPPAGAPAPSGPPSAPEATFRNGANPYGDYHYTPPSASTETVAVSTQTLGAMTPWTPPASSTGPTAGSTAPATAPPSGPR